MLDDMRMKASDIYKLAVKRQKKQDYNPPVYNENKINIRSVFEKGGMCFYVTPKNASVKEYFMFLHGGGFVSQMSRNEWRFVLNCGYVKFILSKTAEAVRCFQRFVKQNEATGQRELLKRELANDWKILSKNGVKDYEAHLIVDIVMTK